MTDQRPPPTDSVEGDGPLPGLLVPQGMLRRLAAELSGRFAGVFSAETVERYVFESYTALLRTAGVHTHLVALTQRFVTDRLTALAQAKGAAPKDAPEVLFVCVHNAGRSQMAAALLHARSSGRIHVRSAGSIPAGQLEPAVVEVMGELGLDLAREFPKPLTDDVVQAADVVVTMGCGDACPVFPGRRYLDWTLDDPAGLDVAAVRPIRDEIERRVRALLEEMDVPTHA